MNRWSNVCPDCNRFRTHCRCKPEDLIRLGGVRAHADTDERIPIEMPPPSRGKHGR